MNAPDSPKRYRAAASCNPATPAADLPALAAEFAKWQAVDLAAVYHHPECGPLAADPKAPALLAAWGDLRSRELIVVYASGPDQALCQKAAAAAVQFFEGKRPAVDSALYGGGPGKPPRGAAPVPKAPPRKASRPVLSGLSPMYSVPVTNELFHNGNVEAWKRVIASYEYRYPGLKVYVYYEGERITNLNALFQWGKVKYGHPIQFAVAGTKIQGLAKLRRCLAEAASPRFGAFLQGPAGSRLELF